MKKKLRILKEIILSILFDIKKDFSEEVRYIPYEPKVLGNKLKERR